MKFTSITCVMSLITRSPSRRVRSEFGAAKKMPLNVRERQWANFQRPHGNNRHNSGAILAPSFTDVASIPRRLPAVA